jgi:N-acetylglucosamine repressor
LKRHRKLASTSSDLKKINRMLVRDTIRKRGPVARSEIARMTGLTPPTISAIVNDMLEADIVREIGRGVSTGGRRPILLELNPQAGFVLAVRIQRGEIVTALLNLTGHVLGNQLITRDTSVPEKVAEAIRESIDSLVLSADIRRERILCCGVAFPGLISSADGMVARAPNLPWEKVPFGDMLREAVGGIPVHVENISNAAALGEQTYGSGRGCANLIYLNLSVGIGAGIIIDNRVYGGAQGYAGEIGHVAVTSETGPRCGCGRYGCFEAVCGVRAVLERIKASVHDETFFDLGLQKDRITINDVLNTNLSELPEVQAILSDTGRTIGLVIGSILNLFNSEMVILGGELSRAGDTFFGALCDQAKRTSLGEVAERVRIVRSTMQEDPALMGAYTLAIEDIFACGQWEYRPA